MPSPPNPPEPDDTPTAPAGELPPRPGDSYVQSFARGLEVIRSFSAKAPQQTLSEVAARTGLTRAGARRILLTLQTLGYVDSDGRWFRLTPRILDLGFAYLSSLPIWNLAEPVMEQLAEQLGESVSAAVLDGTDVVYVLRVSTRKIMRISLAAGSRLPAYCASLGRVLLAGLPDDAARAVLERSDRIAFTRRTLTEVDALMDEVQRARSQGWALVDQELEEGLISMAAPILGRNGQVLAAINVSGQANRTSARQMQQAMLAPLREAAEQIGRLLAAR
ncbi:helix-turn-helix domain-containing protein [Ottowia sp. GY511]|uniref:IclR family transcriptional regulator C-terminal domain-containing protein n=1 Tax=Ottowia flava TaxID=2675430 RepID=A0ABW4KPZ3_9BURK|nr:IclR family transcriptional regulator C-terminal domain-containing protein [Ottowia sp. GY511]TXK28351.1 helix-turn-helix domain-containing protein [Ottowia sp. GY511]